MVSQIFQIWICLENMRDYFWSFYGHFWPFDKDQMRVFLPREFGLILHDFPKLKLYELGTYHLLILQFPFFSFLEIMLRSLKEQTCNDSFQSKIKQKTPLTPVNSTIIRFLFKLWIMNSQSQFKLLARICYLSLPHLRTFILNDVIEIANAKPLY